MATQYIHRRPLTLEQQHRVMVGLLEQLGNTATLRADVYLGFSSMSRLDLAGFVVSGIDSINNLVAMCPLPDKPPPAQSPGVQVIRQLKIALRIASDPQRRRRFLDAIDLRSRPDHPRVIPTWIYALACIPLNKPWTGELIHPQPFCPQLFKAMSQQPQAAQWLVQQTSRRCFMLMTAPNSHPRMRLSRREHEILDLLLKGKSEKEIAHCLGISQHTVHSYVKEIYRIKAVRSRAELIIQCLGRATSAESR